jgi:predicted AAA+ superfamily ATPase
MIKRELHQTIDDKIGSGKVIIVLGPRQVGKTTLIKSVLAGRDHLFLDGDDMNTRKILSIHSLAHLSNIVGKNKLAFIAEAQRIDNIGLSLKIIVDNIPGVQLLVSGSSSFELNSRISESLTGRKWEYNLFPVSWKEFEGHFGYVKSDSQLELRLVYGMYPEVINNPGSEQEILSQLVSSYLYRDILSLSGIRKPEVLDKILRALAFQIGSEVSYNEISQLAGVDKNTVSSYIDLLIKSFVLFRLPSFSRNLRNEIKFNQKIYFLDNGILNAVIGNLSPLAFRNDIGALWENFLISERIKYLSYNQRMARMYFWRTKSQKKIDYLEEASGQILAFEFKWSEKAKLKNHKSFNETYNTEVKLVNRNNFRSFVMD